MPLTTAIEQLNLSFNQLEDRLLLKVGMADQSEIALWITRRVCKELWHLLQESHEQMVSGLKESAEEAFYEERLEELLDSIPLPAPKLVNKSKPAQIETDAPASRYGEKMDFNQTYIANRKPLAGAPILVMSCEVKEDSAEKSSLSFKANAGEVVTMGLTLELVVALTNMMQLATKEASWDLLMLQKHATRHLAPSSEVIH